MRVVWERIVEKIVQVKIGTDSPQRMQRKWIVDPALSEANVSLRSSQ